MIAFKQPLLSSDTQLQPGTSSDSKSTMMDCLAKTADHRRSKVRCGLRKACPITGGRLLVSAGLKCCFAGEPPGNYAINKRDFIRR